MTLKPVSAILFCLLSFTAARAQKSAGEFNTPPDHKVMIIPFNPYYYLSDADLELAEANEISASEISTLFRYGLNYDLSARVISKTNYDILKDTTLDSQKDLRLIYSSIKYEFQRPMDAFAKDSAESKVIEQKDLFGNGGEAEVKKEEEKVKLFNNRDEVVTSTNDRKYLNAVITHPEIFPNLHEKYGADLFVFINQFELITNYNHCLDRSKNYFERKVVVHYSIYDASGKQLKGDAVEVLFSSAETNIDKIIADYFPVISEMLNQSVNLSVKHTQPGK